jgi:hypothetical protein
MVCLGHFDPATGSVDVRKKTGKVDNEIVSLIG